MRININKDITVTALSLHKDAVFYDHQSVFHQIKTATFNIYRIEYDLPFERFYDQTSR